MSAKGFTQKGNPPSPNWLLWVKIAIIALTVAVFAASCYAASVGYWAAGAAGFLIFVCLKTWIIYGLFLFFELKHPHLFFRIAALILYIFSVIFWLSAWAWAASIAGVWLGYVCYGGYCDGYGPYKGFGGAMAAAAALGAIIWVLSIVNLVFFIKGCMHDPEGTGSVQPQQQAELGNVKAQEAEAPAGGYAQPVGHAPQQQYQQYPPQQAAYPQQQQYQQ